MAVAVSVKYKSQEIEIVLPPLHGCKPEEESLWTGSGLRNRLQKLTGVLPENQRILHRGQRIDVDGNTIWCKQRVYEKALKTGKSIKLLLVGSKSDDIKTVSRGTDVRMRNDLPGVDQPLVTAASSSRLLRRNLRPRKFGFQRITSIPHFPEPEKAVDFLERLANDNGVVKIMEKHRWNVGHLTELPPDGQVGVSEVCLMGLNKNHGQEILLRLRTDDLKGFRKYEYVRKVLLHELAHNEWGDHDNNFKILNSQLNREVVELDWTKTKGRRLGSAIDLTSGMSQDEVVRRLLKPVSPGGDDKNGSIRKGDEDAKATQLGAETARAKRKSQGKAHNRGAAANMEKSLSDASQSSKRERERTDFTTMLGSQQTVDSGRLSFQKESDFSAGVKSPQVDVAPALLTQPSLSDEVHGQDNLSELAARQLSSGRLDLDASLLMLKSREDSVEYRERFKIAISTVSKILTNMVRHRRSSKHRRLKFANQAIKSRILRLPGCVQVLLSIGFVLEHQSQLGSPHKAENWHVVFPCGREEDENALSDETCARLNSIIEILKQF